LFNVIKLGSHHVKAGFAKQSVFLVRPHIQLPNTPIKKWGKEYFLFQDRDEKEIEEMCFNCDVNRVFNITGEILVDKFGIRYFNAIYMNFDENEYWITTITGEGYILHQNSLIKSDQKSNSCLFSMAYNKNEPTIFEATLIVQPGDTLVVGLWKSVFHPTKNPFFKEWEPRPQ
jgi:hypothetical protein